VLDVTGEQILVVEDHLMASEALAVAQDVVFAEL
jgi:hypothetical protein